MSSGTNPPSGQDFAGIDPVHLLNAVILNGQEIIQYNFDLFPIHKRNIRKTIRQTELELLFLTRIHDEGCRATPSAITALSSLCKTLSGLRNILRNAARRQSRLLTLSGCAKLFRDLSHAFRVATEAFDGFLAGVAGVPKEIVNLAKFTNAHLKNMRLRPGPAETNALLLHEIIQGFENDVKPSDDAVRGILSYLEINSWLDCEQQLLFLSKELSSPGQDKENYANVINGLIAFMVYSRCVMFFETDGGSSKYLEQQFYFYCPLSVELMVDPVILPTGHTYDRASILKYWLKLGRHKNCPVTGHRLIRSPTNFDRNVALRNQIQTRFYDDNDVKKYAIVSANDGSVASSKAMKMVVLFLEEKASSGTVEVKRKVSYEMLILAKMSIVNVICLKKDVAMIMSRCLCSLHDSSDPLTRWNSKTAKPQPCTETDRDKYLGPKRSFTNQHVLEVIMELFELGSLRLKKKALASLPMFLKYYSNCYEISEIGVMPHLMSFLLDSKDEVVEGNTLDVLVCLTEYGQGVEDVIKSSIVSWIMQVIDASVSSSSSSFLDKCMLILVQCFMSSRAMTNNRLKEFASFMPSMSALSESKTISVRFKAVNLTRLMNARPSLRNKNEFLIR